MIDLITGSFSAAQLQPVTPLRIALLLISLAVSTSTIYFLFFSENRIKPKDYWKMYNRD